MIRVGVLDRDPARRAGIRAVLEPEGHVSVVAEGPHSETLRLVPAMRPRILITSHPSEADALATLRLVRGLPGAHRILVLTDQLTDSGVRQLLVNDPAGILHHEDAASLLPWAVHTIDRGGRAFGPQVTDALVSGSREQHRSLQEEPAHMLLSLLSIREQEVLRFVGDGLSNPAIAESLGISAHTVKDHMRSIYDKLGVANRVLAARVAWQASIDSVSSARDPA